MIYSQNNKQDQGITPDLTPLLDIIFIVMVFLLLTANVQLNTMKIDLPQTHDAAVLAAHDNAAITINVLTGEPAWAIEGQTAADWDAFNALFRQQIQRQPQRQVIIAADKNASVENMLKVMALMQQHQIRATNILMEQE